MSTDVLVSRPERITHRAAARRRRRLPHRRAVRVDARSSGNFEADLARPLVSARAVPAEVRLRLKRRRHDVVELFRLVIRGPPIN